MTLSYKTEKIEIHSVVREISSCKVEGRKKSISKNLKNKSTCRHSINYKTLMQDILYHSFMFSEITTNDLSIDVYIDISSPQRTVLIEGCKKYLKLKVRVSTSRIYSGETFEYFSKSFWDFKEGLL
jgi:hypothetical protein